MPSYDVMPDVQLFQPTEVDDAVSLANQYKEDGWILGGGQDTYGWLKDRAKNPKALIDINGVDSFRGIRQIENGIEIGSTTTLLEIIKNPIINNSFSLLSDAAERVASPQIRNVGTLGGNLIQDTRCWYYRRGLACYRAGGNLCYADGPEAMNREHALFNASRCVAVSASDTATALMALDANMIAISVDGKRSISVEDFFVGPDTHITRMTSLEPGEILSAIHIPAKWSKANFYFEKIADRDVWDFALVSIAVAMNMENKKIVDSRFVYGGVAATPYRVKHIERTANGKSLSKKTGEDLAKLASEGAKPLKYNRFKLPLMENLLRRAMRG